MKRSYQLGFLFVLSTLAFSNASCPAPELIKPCTCDEISFTCGSSSEQQLNRAFTSLRRFDDGRISIKLTNFTLPFVPYGLFTGLKIGSLEMHATRLKTFYDVSANKSSLSGQENTLVSLTLTCTEFCHDFDWQSLSPLEQLYNLFIKGKFTNINMPFPNLAVVVNFWIQDTDISYIADKAFAGMTAVQDLRMMSNKVKGYSRNMFAYPATNVTLFIVKGDLITVLAEDHFDAMPSLVYADIPSFAHNIPPIMSDYRAVNLQGSRGLTCDSRLKWLLRMRDQGTVNILHAICARPKHLYWRDVQSLSYDDL